MKKDNQKPYYAASVKSLPQCITVNPCSTITLEDFNSLVCCNPLAKYSCLNASICCKDGVKLSSLAMVFLHWAKEKFTSVLIQSWTLYTVRFTIITPLNPSVVVSILDLFCAKNKFITPFLSY